MAVYLVLKRVIVNQGTDGYERSKLSDLDFADNMTTFLDSTQGLQGLVTAISKIAGGLGLSVSDKKTKIMLSGNRQPPYDVLISQNKVEVIENFTYLGGSINNQGTMHQEITCRIGKAWCRIQFSSTRFGQARSLPIKLNFTSTIPVSCLPYSTAVKPGT